MMPLHVNLLNLKAVGHDNGKMVEALLNARAELNGGGSNGGTPLHMAVHTGRISIAKQLLLRRADPEIRCNNGQTVLQKAKTKGRKDVIQAIAAGCASKAAGEVVQHMTRQQGESQPLSEMLVADSGCNGLAKQNELQDQLGVSVDHVADFGHETIFVANQTLALRRAFIVTNSSYAPDRPDLNTVEPGRKLQRALQRSGFEVVLLENVTEAEFWKHFEELECQLGAQPLLQHLVFFYFAGHGAEKERELWMMMRQSSRGISLLQVLHRLLMTAPQVAVLAVPDCCRENSQNDIFRVPPDSQPSGSVSARAVGFRTAGLGLDQRDVARTPDSDSSAIDDSATSNFYILWAGDQGTCIRDTVEDSLGYQIATSLFASPGISLAEILNRASEQVKLHRKAAGELQRPWSECGVAQDLGQRVLRPVLCKRCDSLRKRSRIGQGNGGSAQEGTESQSLLTAEHFATMLSSPCGSFEHCALAALNALESRFLEEQDDFKRWAPLRAFFCAAVRAGSISVLQFMAHLHPELISVRGFDAFENAHYYCRGIPSPSSLRQTPVLAVAAGVGRQSHGALAFLLQARANIGARDLEGWTAHQHASYFGNYQALETLLRASPPPAPDLQRWSLQPLHLAAGQGHRECVELLLKFRAQVDAIPPGWTMKDAETPVVAHADQKKVWYQRSLLERLVRESSQKLLGGVTALHLAALSGYAGCVTALLQASADPNACAESGFCALQLCVKKWHMRHQSQRTGRASQDIDFEGVFDALVASGARDILPEYMETSLHAVAFHWGSVHPSHTKHIGHRLVNEAESSLGALGPKGGTPLHFAVNGRNWAMCSLLLELRADPSVRNDGGRAVWDLPLLREAGNWPHANAAECCDKLLKLKDCAPKEGN